MCEFAAFADLGDKMKLNPNFVVHNTGKETLLVPTAKVPFHGLVQGNPTVEFILNCLSKDTTEEEIVSAMSKEYQGELSDMSEDVASVIAQLKEIGAIDE